MSEIRTVTPDLLEQLRERSRNGYLNQIVNQVTPIKSTVEKPMTEEEHEALISSIFDD